VAKVSKLLLKPKHSVKFVLPNPVPKKVEATKGEKTRMQELSSAEILKNVFANDASYATIEGVLKDTKLLKKFNNFFKKGGKPVYHFDKKNLLVEHKWPKTKRSIEYQWLESFYAQQKVMLTKFDKREWTVYNREGGFMDYITNIVKTEFKEKVSQKDAWNPADIWLVRNQKNIENHIKHITRFPANQTSIEDLNGYLTELYMNARRDGTKGDALTGISLKKISGEEASYEEVNLDPEYFSKIVRKSGKFLYKLSKINMNLQIEKSGKNWKFKTQDTQLFLKDNTKAGADRYSFQIKGNETSKESNLKYEGTDLQNRAALLGKAPLELMEIVAKNHKQTTLYNQRTKAWQSYPTSFPKAKEKDGQGNTFADYTTLFNAIKSTVDVGGVKNGKEFEENFKKVFANSNIKERAVANNKLMQLNWIWKLLTVFGNENQRDKYLTDILYICQKKGNKIFKFGPFGKLY
jgi:hypothetical protein